MDTTPIQRIRFWFNAFVPAHIPGYTEVVQEGPHAGRTALVNIGSPSGLLLTDQRPFSNDVAAEGRAHSFGQITFRERVWRMEQQHRTRALEPITASNAEAAQMDVATATAATEQMSLTLYTSRTLTSTSPVAAQIRLLPGFGIGTPLDEMLFVYVACRATIPDPQLAGRLGEIAYRGIVAINLAQRSVEFHGHVGRFPAYELYVAADNDPPQAVFRLSPIRGERAYDGVFTAPRPMRGRVELR
jgi:hypothetical protein